MSSAQPRHVVDAHLHLWQYDPVEYGWIDGTMSPLRRDFLPADAQDVMRRAGVDACIAVQARQTLEETRWLLELADSNPCIAGVVGWVDLQSDELGAQLDAFTNHARLVGVRHIVQAEPDDFLQDQYFRRGVARLGWHGLAYDILIYARQLSAAIDFAAAFPDGRFVLDHLGKPDIRANGFDVWRHDLDRIVALPNVVAKLSGLVTEADWNRWTIEDLHRYVNAALDRFGPDRLMIGSDWPVCTLAGEYDQVLDVVRTAISGRPAAAQDAILGGTAKRFWHLEKG